MYVEEMRWSARGLAILVALFVLVLVSILGPAFLLSSRGRGIPLAVTLISLVLVVLFAATLWIFTLLRLTIDDQALTIGYGPFRERVALDQIVSCRRTTYNWLRWGGFGIRVARKAKLYNVPGDGGIAAEIELRDGRRLLFSSRDPEVICRIMRERRGETQ